MFAQTIYESRARTHISTQDIAEITARALPNNLANGLTGYMYFDDWRFLHIIEGRPAQVAETMKRIVNNPMHHAIKVRLMNRSSVRNFAGWPFGAVSAEDFELHRIIKNLGYHDLFHANVLDAIKVLKRLAGRKLRTMSVLEKQVLHDPRLLHPLKPEPSLTEDILGLH